MAKQQAPLVAFNRGIISPLALGRVDVKHVGMAAETQTNWMPRVLGSMMLRPGLEYVAPTEFSVFQANYLPFIKSASDTAILEMTSSTLRVLVDEEFVGADDPSVSTAITNGLFNTDLSSWTDADQAGATSSWVAGALRGYMKLIGTGFNYAMRKQTVTVSASDISKRHRLYFETVLFNPDTKYAGSVTVRVGSSDGADDYVATTTLATGDHCFSFTPTGDFYIQVFNSTEYAAVINMIKIDQGTMDLTAPWTSAASAPSTVRLDQSADVLFVTTGGKRQYVIKRYAAQSWGVEHYVADDGPFRLQNTDDSFSLTPSALSGDVTLTSSNPLFRSSHVGALFSIDSTGQSVSKVISAADQWSDPIRVIGVGTARTITINTSGVWVGTVRLQSSVGAIGSWANVPGESWTVNVSTTYADGLDNQVVHYRIGIATAEYTSGTVTASLTFAAGSITGIARVIAYTSSTSVTAAVLKSFGGLTASTAWSEGLWSDYRGFPTAVCLFEGRLWFAGKGNIVGSVSDAYASFDDTVEGDSGPINTSIGSGPVDTINWILPLLRLLLGGEGAEHSCRSSAIDSPLTPTDFAIRTPSTRGSAAVPAIKRDLGGFFVDQTGSRLIEISIENATYSYDYQTVDMSLFAPELTAIGITRIAIQRRPDTRIHCVLADGTAAVFIEDPLEGVKAWVTVETDGDIVDVVILPNPDSTEDKVYYAVDRAPDTGHKYGLERWALESECVGGTLNKQADCFTIYSGSAKSVFNCVTDLPLDGLGNAIFGTQDIVVWGDGRYVGTITPSGGDYTLPVSVSNAVLGLPYTAQYKSTKLAYAAKEGTALTQRKTITHLGAILYNTHYQGLQYGRDFDNLRSLPAVVDGKVTPVDTIWTDYDKKSFAFDGTWDTDARLCLQATAPLPVTVLAAIVGVQTSEDP